jgi:uncharacterized membrane protein YeaQ/YmgE (transglycosylase-associated protein family)
MDMIIGFVVLLVLGLVVGALAKFIMPGDDPGGILVTSILGIVGAILGGWIASWLEVGGITGLDWRSLVTAVGGALVLLLAYRAIRMLAPRSASPTYLAGRTGTGSPLQAYSAHSDSEATDSVAALTETANEAFTANVLQKLSGSLGENTGATRKALEAIVPTILAGMSNHASTTAGASRLFDLAKGVAQGGTDLIGRLDSHVDEHGLDALSRTGGSVLSTLFGDKLNGLISWLTRYAGIKESSATSLMGVATNLVLGVLGKDITQKGLTSASFGRMLASLGEPLSKLLPSGIGDVPGMRALADLGGRAAATTRAAVETGQRVGATARGAYRETAGVVRQETPWLAAIAPLLLLAIPLALFAYTMRGAAAKLINQAENIQVNVPAAMLPTVTRAQSPDPFPALVPEPARSSVPDVSRFSTELTDTFSKLTEALTSVKDAASAELALPKLQDLDGKLDVAKTTTKELGDAGRTAIKTLVTAAEAKLKVLVDKVLSIPGVGDKIKTVVDSIMAKLTDLAA